jgi:uncharacterized OB-fold protein
MSTQRTYPAPAQTPETAPFWRASEQGKFLVKRCTACKEAHWYPRAICPFCSSDETVWEESAGRGKIYTYTVMRKSPQGPYALGYVSLAEGPAVYTNFVDCDFASLRIGADVRVVFKPSVGGPPLPFFTLV